MLVFLSWFAINILKIKKSYQIGSQSEQHDDATHDDCYANDLINDFDTVCIEFCSDLIHQPCQSPPPQHGACHDACEAHDHLERMIGQHECELGVHGQEEEDDKRIGERDEECRPRVVPQRALLLAALVHLLSGVGVVRVPAEAQQQYATRYLQVEAVLVVGDEIHDERHAVAGKGGIDDVAGSGTDTCSKAEPSAFVECALNAKDANGPHGRTGNHTDQHPLEDEV